MIQWKENFEIIIITAIHMRLMKEHFMPNG